MALSEKVLMVELVMSINRLLESAKNAPIRQGEWNPTTVLGHIAQVDEQVWLARVKLMVKACEAGTGEPDFQWWEPDPIETEKKYSDYTLEIASAEVIHARTKLISYLKSLSETHWDARAKHATFGSINVRELVFRALSHDEEHRESFV